MKTQTQHKQNQILVKSQPKAQTQGKKQTPAQTNTQIQNKARSRSEWLEWYEAHGGSKDLKLAPDEHILFHPEHGFVAFLVYDDTLELHHMAGDGKYWFSVLEKVMRLEGLKIFRAYTERNPKAWMRKYGNKGRIKGYYMEANIDDVKF